MTTNKQILEKAIQKAIDGGWNPFPNGDADSIKLLHLQPFEHIIFNHDFAKALWGRKARTYGRFFKVYGLGEEWQLQLQQMVIADDPIKYLGENI